MTSFPPDAEIHAFWDWFETIAPALAEEFDTPEILRVLDEKVSHLGEVSWELGPGRTAPNALILTPDGDLNWLPVTKYIVTFAPSIPGWEFHSAKPCKTWTLTFSLEADDGSVIEVDAKNWRYVLHRFSDNTFDITLRQDGTETMSEDDRYIAATIILDGVLGEEVRMSSIGAIEIVEEFSADEEAGASPISVLHQHLASLIGIRSEADRRRN